MKTFGHSCGRKLSLEVWTNALPPNCPGCDNADAGIQPMTLLRDTGAVVAGPLLQAQIDEGAPGNGFRNGFGRTIEEQMAHERAGFLEAPNLAFSITKGAAPAPSSLSFFVSDGTAWPLGKGAGRCINTSGAGSQCKLPLHHSGYHRDGGGVWGGLQELATEDFDANTEQLKEHVRKTDDLRIMSRKEAEQAKMKADWEAAAQAEVDAFSMKLYPGVKRDPKPPPNRLGPNVFRTRCGAERRVEGDVPGYDQHVALLGSGSAGSVRIFERSGWTGHAWLWHEKGERQLPDLSEPAAPKLKRLETEHMKLRDQLGDKDKEIADLRAEVGRLALDSRRAGR